MQPESAPTKWGENRYNPQTPPPSHWQLVGTREVAIALLPRTVALTALQPDCESSPQDGWHPPHTPGPAGAAAAAPVCLFLLLWIDPCYPGAGFSWPWPLLPLSTQKALSLGPKSRTWSRILLNFSTTQHCLYFSFGAKPESPVAINPCILYLFPEAAFLSL